MTRWTKDRIYRMKLEKLLDEGMDGDEASRLASQQADEDFDELCDQAYQAAKDRRLDRD